MKAISFLRRIAIITVSTVSAIVLGMGTVAVFGQATSVGGVFNPIQDYVVGGTWTFKSVPIMQGLSGVLVGNNTSALTAVTAPSGTIVGTTDTQILTNKTLTSPTITSPTISDATITGVNSVQAKASTADFTANSGSTGATLTNITGLTGFSLVAGATYQFRIVVPVATQTANGGAKMAFKFTTATLTSINARVYSSTDTDNTGAVSTSFTTATDQATWFDQKAVVFTYYVIEGSLVVNAAGTVAIQAAQNTSHADTTTLTKGVTAVFTRVL